MEYDHGRRVTPHVWELSPLDLCIQQYENRCKNYHYRKLKVAGETEEQRKERLAGLKVEMEQLKHERRTIMSMVSVQSQLQQYRDEFRGIEDDEERIEAYEQERHHPTEVLETNLRLVGRAKPSKEYTAHHIVEGKGKLPATADVRLTLFMHDVRINDPDNGVWMPRSSEQNGHWAMPKATPHSKIHTHNYERWVYGQINNLNSESEIRAKLTIIRTHLKSGTQPEKVTAPSDKNWNGQ
ncbi:AHH domain-containing protein [Microbulbifer sp. ANSA003]|uniref:AHH domain-containing protein n=1 Tax=Microbulbifer sp. ANSA003 TaxID=3243360 RepID=UPI0040427326